MITDLYKELSESYNLSINNYEQLFSYLDMLQELNITMSKLKVTKLPHELLSVNEKL